LFILTVATNIEYILSIYHNKLAVFRQEMMCNIKFSKKVNLKKIYLNNNY